MRGEAQHKVLSKTLVGIFAGRPEANGGAGMADELELQKVKTSLGKNALDLGLARAGIQTGKKEEKTKFSPTGALETKDNPAKDRHGSRHGSLL